MRHLALVLAVVLALVAPALAGPREDLAAALAVAKTAPEPAFAFFRLFATLPDATWTADDVHAAAETAGVAADSSLGKLLASATKLSKKGENVELSRKDADPIALGENEGWLWLGKKVTFRARPEGGGDTVDSFDGAQVSEKKDSTKGSLKKLRFEQDKATKKPVLKLTAGLAFFTQTETIPWEPVAPTPGLAGSVPGRSP